MQLLDHWRALVSTVRNRLDGLVRPVARRLRRVANPLPERHASDQAEKGELLAGANFGAVFESSAEALLLVDERGYIRRANQCARDLLRLKEHHPGRLKLAEILSSASTDELEHFLARVPRALPSGLRAAAQEAAAFDGRLGTGFPVRLMRRALLPGSGEWLLCAEDRTADVTGGRQIQSKLLQTEKMAALGQLVSGIAHELNNPLTAIMGYAQLLLGHGLQAAQLSEARKVFQQAERARRIVKNLLYFARENKPERTRVDLNEIVERTLALRSYELKVENIAVECDLARDLPETVGDPYQLQQVALNLLVNAEQALLLGRGRGQVWIRTRRLEDDKIALEVSDDGPGIPLDIASRIFDPFFTTKPSGIGTGLGLSIVYGIVQQHGGEVTFESRPGAGAKFVVELPVVSLPAAAQPAALAAPVWETQVGACGRILVVEDEVTVAQLIVDVLREEGHQVEAVLDSQEGLTRISRTNFDLVICDLRMPRLDGPAFFEALVAAGSPVQKRIIFITGDTLAPRTLEFLEPHRLPYLAKPFLVEELKLAVHRMLEKIRRPETVAELAKEQTAGPAQ
jgi:two-component system cell cycle sensor histidine kinase/response regulator CckA